MDVSKEVGLKLFLSDFHLGNYFSKEKEICSFLDNFRETSVEIFLLGDIFDFWRKCCFSKYKDFFHGLNIWYIVGNHDFEIEFASPFSERISSFVKIQQEGIEIVGIHGHELDKETSFLSPICSAIEYLFYSFSTWVNTDLREKCVPLMEWYHEKKGFYSSLAKKYESSQILILGHTHKPGKFVEGNLKIFNLGSWLSTPMCFALKGNQGCFFLVLEFSGIECLSFKPISEI